jgi:hypothetical protein
MFGQVNEYFDKQPKKEKSKVVPLLEKVDELNKLEEGVKSAAVGSSICVNEFTVHFAKKH